MHDTLYLERPETRSNEDALFGNMPRRWVQTSAGFRSDLAEGTPRRRVESDFESRDQKRRQRERQPSSLMAKRYDGTWRYEPFADYLKSVLRDL